MHNIWDRSHIPLLPNALMPLLSCPTLPISAHPSAWSSSLPIGPRGLCVSSTHEKGATALSLSKHLFPYQEPLHKGREGPCYVSVTVAGERCVEMGPGPRKRKRNWENAGELPLLSLKKKKKSRERKEWRETTPNNNFPNKTTIIIKQSYNRHLIDTCWPAVSLLLFTTPPITEDRTGGNKF